ncbi:MAG: hypothetical protein PHN38_04580 [Sulfurospirillaceae bacterium]|nr:hypothetical protein [Sulfurospirillaceae bacterium]MDD3463450.1 hypothetical protein [Sulfurospirillaceae bacterium]
MILIGHDIVPFQPLFLVSTKEDIANTPSNANILFIFNKALLGYCVEQKIPFSLHVEDIKELVIGNALGASYLLVSKKFAKQAQKIAEEYFFDSKILLLGKKEDDIEFAAFQGIDGIIFKKGIRHEDI